MTPEQFAYWFQGFAETSTTAPTDEQWELDHFTLHNPVFDKITQTDNQAGKINKPWNPQNEGFGFAVPLHVDHNFPNAVKC